MTDSTHTHSHTVPLSSHLQQLKDIIDSSRDIVFFGGAGVSTESGIPDFRSETGLFKARAEYGHRPEYLVSHTCFTRETELFFRYYMANLVFQGIEPNPAHYALAELERRGVLKAVITQNVDGLHQKAGSKVVYELHGSAERNYCMNCKTAYDLDYVVKAAQQDDSSAIPRCEKCGGIVRPDVVLYEEPLDDAVMEASIEAITTADTLIIGGTSLVVYPAAGFVDLFRGKDLVIINKSTTDRDSRATLVIQEPIGVVLSQVV